MRRPDYVAARLRGAPTPYDILKQAARRRPLHPVIEFMSHPRDDAPSCVSYSDLLAQTQRAMGALRRRGVTLGDGVAVMAPTTPEGIVALIAASSVGTAFPMNMLLSEEALSSQLKLARTKLAIAARSPPVVDVHARVVRARPPGLAHVYAMALDGEPSDWAQALERAPRHTRFVGAPRRVAALFHTGGTTGAPKLAELSAFGMAASAWMGAAATGWTEEDRIVCGLPLFHVGGAICCVLTAIALGATIVLPGILGARDPAFVNNAWSFIETTRATVLVMVPTTLGVIANVPLCDANIGSLRAICTGAAALPLGTGQRLEALTGVPVCQIYGMTEASGFISAQPSDGVFRAPAVGYATTPMRLSLRTNEGVEARAGQIYYKGPSTFSGYRILGSGAPAPKDGWIASGDLGEMGTDGQLRLRGRSKDVIIRGGHNIDPESIEAIATQHPDVAGAAAVPMPDGYAGEVPVLFIVLRQDAGQEADDILAFISERISEPPARPKRLFVVDALPLTAVGKVMRFTLRQRAAVVRVAEELNKVSALRNIACDDPAGREIRIVVDDDIAEDVRSDICARVSALGLVPKLIVHATG